MELINDSTYECKTCGEVIKAFTSSGDTQFCTSCGNSNLEGYDDED